MKDKILKILRDRNDFVSGQELCQEFNVTRSAVWKNINTLKAQGYEIESVTNKGYRLTQEPDFLNSDDIKSGLITRILGNEIFVFNSVDSTNNVAKKYADNGTNEGAVFLAETQTNGKGRLGRAWSSEPFASIYCSIILKPRIEPQQISNITLLIGLAVCKAIRHSTGCDAKIKWPNDIVIGKRKICGILAEISAEADGINYVIVGIGVNVNNKDFPQEISHKTTSLFLETGERISRKIILQSMLLEIEKYYQEYLANPNCILEEYKKYCVSLGRNVSTTRLGITISGEAVDISQNGEIIIEDQNGIRHQIFSGEVSVQDFY